jgi:hypothetical protein
VGVRGRYPIVARAAAAVNPEFLGKTGKNPISMLTSSPDLTACVIRPTRLLDEGEQELAVNLYACVLVSNRYRHALTSGARPLRRGGHSLAATIRGSLE